MPQYESNVKEHRERLGLSQEALARQLGVSRQTIVNIERGLSEPRIFLALAIAGVLGVAVGELFRKGMLL
jgi:putative transcriptional regulator